MTAIDSAEVINELESECECAREVLAAMQAQRDHARSVAVALEQENAQVRYWLTEWFAYPNSDTEMWKRSKAALFAFMLDGSLSGGEQT